MNSTRIFILSTIFLYVLIPGFSQEKFVIPFEKSKGKETTTYFECIDYYIQLANQYESIHIQEYGMTDSGYPLHIIMYNPNENFNHQNTSNLKILVINAIHPGEPAGVDASMMLLRDLASGIIPDENLKGILLTVIPIYNIGGALNRSSYSRANQNGPEEYGFRGNAKNLDLNRDFIKMDSKNARSFVKWFQEFNPEIFVDTHTTNGADYQYKMTYVETHPQKLGGSLGHFLKETFSPSLVKSMTDRGYEICPFVNIYRNSDYFEDNYRQYPIYRVLK